MNKKIKYKKELIITESFDGSFEYGIMRMRSEDELETFNLKKGDKVYIYRKIN